jgi:ferredoxin
MNYACQHCHQVCSVSKITNAHTAYNQPQKTFDSTDHILGVEVCMVCERPTAIHKILNNPLLWWKSAMFARKILFRVSAIFL